jgi:hypothetical protein
MSPTVTPPTQVPPAVEPAGGGGERRRRDRRRPGPGGSPRPAEPPADEADTERPEPGEGHVDVIA